LHASLSIKYLRNYSYKDILPGARSPNTASCGRLRFGLGFLPRQFPLPEYIYKNNFLNILWRGRCARVLRCEEEMFHVKHVLRGKCFERMEKVTKVEKK